MSGYRGYSLRLGRKPQVSDLRTVYLQHGLEPSEEDHLLGVVRVERAADLVNEWNRGEPLAQIDLTIELEKTARGHAERMRRLLR